MPSNRQGATMVKNSKNNNLGIVAGTNGGYQVVTDVNKGSSEVKVPPAEPAPIPQGFAKASPVFKPATPKVKAVQRKEDEEDAIKQNSVKEEDVK